MLYIIRTSPGYLALANSETDALVMLAGPNVALPDAAFWSVLKAKGIYDAMVKENPERMKRVEANGVGALRQEKDILTRAGLTRANAHSTKPTPGTVETAAVAAMET